MQVTRSGIWYEVLVASCRSLLIACPFWYISAFPFASLICLYWILNSCGACHAQSRRPLQSWYNVCQGWCCPSNRKYTCTVHQGAQKETCLPYSVFGVFQKISQNGLKKVAIKMEDSIFFSKLGKNHRFDFHVKFSGSSKNLQPHHAILIIFGAAAVTNQFLLKENSQQIQLRGSPKVGPICQAFGVVFLFFWINLGIACWLETPSGSGINQFDVATSGVALLVFNWLVNFWILVHLNDLNVKGRIQTTLFLWSRCLSMKNGHMMYGLDMTRIAKKKSWHLGERVNLN